MELSLSNQASLGINALLDANKYTYEKTRLEQIKQFLIACCEQMKQPCAYHLTLKVNKFADADITQVTDWLRRKLPSVMWLWSREYSPAKHKRAHIHLLLVVDNKLTHLEKVFILRKHLAEAFGVENGGFFDSVTLHERSVKKSSYHILKSEMEDAMTRFGYLAKLEQKTGVQDRQTFGYTRKATTTHSAWH